MQAIREEIAQGGKRMKRLCHRFAYKRYPFLPVHHGVSRWWKMVLSTANLIWFDSWVEIMTVKWFSSAPFCEAKRIPDWFKLWLFRCINCVCVLASTPGSDLWALWRWRVSHAKLLGPLFSSQMRCAKISCEPLAAQAKWKGELLQTRATVNTPETPNPHSA